MRRVGTTVVLVVIAVAAVLGTALISYQKGSTDGMATAAADRGAFAARGTLTGGATGQGGFPGGGAAGGFPGGGAVGTGAAGSSVAGGGTNANAAGGVTGKVTKVDGGTLSIQQQPGNANLTIATSGTTTVTTFAAAAMSDLKTGDLIAVQGDKTGDNAYTAKVLLGLGTLPGAAGGGGAPSGGASGAASAAPGSGGAGGQGRGPGGAGGGAGGFGNLTGGGPFGRITKIDGATITLQGLDGTTTTTVTTNSGTSVRKQAMGKVDDIKVGDTITVQGEKTGDTAYTARTIIDQGAA